MAGDSEESASQGPSEPSRSPPDADDTYEQDQLQIARRFLDADNVRSASREGKARFLKSKGISDGDIEMLLAEEITPSHSSEQTAKAAPINSTDDAPPVVTYPEFLAKPVRPPPLVTTYRLFNTLYGFAGIATLLYGISKYYVAPMVDELTDARSGLYATANRKLLALLSALESSVSTIPAGASHGAHADAASDAEDPFEMFHRDIGTQTSLPVSPTVAAQSQSIAASAADRQTDRLCDAVRALSGLKDQYRSHSEDLENVRTLLDVLRDDLDSMTYGSRSQFHGGYEIYGAAKRIEPDDEIRKVRDNIRRVKGILLSTRSFPSSTR
ncbi:hypothetical protein L249_0019 [Ophiocordyceps polyrhachis-furcata BCC 54312]|uniref:Peroxisomal membrane protein PEX14 n=1 Tax=Ophiocordyceps polyrhachis-furcata BCC 54312 TaxID=1330021 RepID=A0A367LEY8_9HYPO|nr:hypothetical protein L249_0019 [Ophiocordyceps polyrhachis-furcata BCC 54312]